MENINELKMEEMEEVNGGQGGSSKKLSPKAGYVVYQIVYGDTLTRIAHRFGTTIDAIKRANPTIKDVNDITAGFWIYIPQ